MYKHILIPTDGSERSARAIAQGMALAAAVKARVTALMATVPVPPSLIQNRRVTLPYLRQAKQSTLLL